MIKEFWQQHVAWRFMPTSRAYDAWKLEHDRRCRLLALQTSRCTRCHGPRADDGFARCPKCRAFATAWERRKRKRREAERLGLKQCAKCRLPNPSAFKHCRSCRAKMKGWEAKRRKARLARGPHMVEDAAT